MDCREFRDRHLAFVDGSLAGEVVASMEAHLAECSSCARHDTAMRRGLLVFRNLPSIEPSPDFLTRLSARLQQVERAEARAAVYRGPGFGSFALIAASVIAVGFLAATAFDWTAPARNLSLPPVVAMQPALPPASGVNTGFVVSAAAGLPLWPAAIFAEQAPVHFANEQFRLAPFGR